jgi:hypothetical protein
MNKIFAHALALTVNVYLEQKSHGEQGDAVLLTQAKGIIDDACEHGLIKWVDGLPVVNMLKMTGETINERN